MPAVARKKQRVERRYDRLSRYYDSLDKVGKGEATRRMAAVKLLNPMPHEKILDAGTGSGWILPRIAERLDTGTVIGTDISVKMLSIARKRAAASGLAGRIKLKRDDIEDMSFPDECFDAIIATYTLTTVPGPKTMMKECARVLKPGGRMVILDTGPPTSGGGWPLYLYMRATAALVGYTHINRKLADYIPPELAIVKEQRHLATIVYCTLLVKGDPD